MEKRVGEGGIGQVLEKILLGSLIVLGIAALVLFLWILVVFANALTATWLKVSMVVAVTLIPAIGILGGFVGFKWGRRDTNMVLGGFWKAIDNIIPQMNAHASEMSDIRITSARRMYREDPHSLTIDASVPRITERVQDAREETV